MKSTLLDSNIMDWRNAFRNQNGIPGLDRGSAPPLADLENTFIHYNIPYFVGNLAIANYTGYDATDFYRGKYGSSLVTIWLGSNPNMADMAGHMPDIITFNAKGAPLNVYHGNGLRVGAGGIYQQIMRNQPMAPFENPTYIRIYAGGFDAVCVSAVMISGYGGFAAMWTADTMIGCTNFNEIHKLMDQHGNERVGYEDSFATIQGYRPKCLWLDRDSSYGLKVKGIDLHIPSMIATPERQQAWLANPDLLCNQSPRQNTARHESRDNTNAPLYWSARIFNPPLQYVKHTLLDLIPERIFHWRPSMDQIGPKVYVERFGDNQPPLNGPSIPTWQKTIDKRDLPAPLASERKLIISRSAISAKGKCVVDNNDHHEIGDGSDYLSLQERIYCDIMMKTSYPLCDETYQSYCFDADMMMLRSHGDVEADLTQGNITASRILKARSELWAPPPFVPLYGIPYVNINSIS